MDVIGASHGNPRDDKAVNLFERDWTSERTPMTARSEHVVCSIVFTFFPFFYSFPCWDGGNDIQPPSPKTWTDLRARALTKTPTHPTDTNAHMHPRNIAHARTWVYKSACSRRTRAQFIMRKELGVRNFRLMESERTGSKAFLTIFSGGDVTRPRAFEVPRKRSLIL